MKRSAAAVCLMAMLCVNCGSIIHQTTQEVKLNSEPSGAAVMVACGDVTNDPRMVTPAVVNLHRKPEICTVKLNKEGYAETELKFGRQMSGLYLGNILVGGIIGFIVDAANGAMWNRTMPASTTKNQAGEINVTLVPVNNATN